MDWDSMAALAFMGFVVVLWRNERYWCFADVDIALCFVLVQILILNDQLDDQLVK